MSRKHGMSVASRSILEAGASCGGNWRRMSLVMKFNAGYEAAKGCFVGRMLRGGAYCGNDWSSPTTIMMVVSDTTRACVLALVPCSHWNKMDALLRSNSKRGAGGS